MMASSAHRRADVQETNALTMVLPAGMALQEASVELSKFGDVAHLDVLPMPMPTIAVAFYDLRCAVRAREHFAEITTLEFAGQLGNRRATVPGDLDLDEAEMHAVSNIINDTQRSGNYIMEFFDIRDAARVREMAKKASGPKHVDVYISGLPNSLCNKISMEAVLEQAGLADSVVKFHAKPGTPCGELNVTLRGENAAMKCTHHFHGRNWDPSGAIVFAATVSVYNARVHRPEPAATAKKALPVEYAQKSAPMKAVKPAQDLSLPPGLECLGSAFSSALFAAFDVEGEEAVKAPREAEHENSTDAGTSDADGEHDEECFVDDRVAAPCC